MKTYRSIRAAFVAALGTLLIAAPTVHAGEQHFGEAIDTKAPKGTLAELIAKPKAYEGKKVVVEGRFAGEAPR